MKVAVAPERRDIIWKNCSRRADVNEGREFNANMYLILGAALWSVPLALIQIFANAEMFGESNGLTDEFICLYFINTHISYFYLFACLFIV